MMESDADRLESIKALGGQLVLTDFGEIWMLFDEDGVQVSLDNIHVNSTSPQVTLRASDAAAAELKRGSQLEINKKRYTVREPTTGPAPGWASYLLDAD